MATLTATQLSDLRADLGDTGGTPAFSDAELQALWDRLTAAPNETVQHEATLALAFRQLLAQATKFHSYSAGQVSENLQQIRDNIAAMFELYKPSLDAATDQSRQLIISKVGKRDKQERTEPAEAFDLRGNTLNVRSNP